MIQSSRLLLDGFCREAPCESVGLSAIIIYAAGLSPFLPAAFFFEKSEIPGIVLYTMVYNKYIEREKASGEPPIPANASNMNREETP